MSSQELSSYSSLESDLDIDSLFKLYDSFLSDLDDSVFDTPLDANELFSYLSDIAVQCEN